MSAEAEPAAANRLAGRTALVTGSARGIGRTIAEHLGRAGAAIVVTDLDPEGVADTVDALAAQGVVALGVQADLSEPAQTHALAKNVLERVDHLDILVNNAGMSRRASFWHVTDADWDYQVNVNYRAPFILSQYAARRMLERGVPGRIVNIGSIGAQRCHRDAAVYDSAKAAIEALTRNMALELAPHGIAVNCVVPGSIADRPGVVREPDLWHQAAASYIPAGRVGRAEDVAAAVLFFCLPESAFTTGQSLLVDGGQGAYLPEN
jgi:glucose 1-dehydrogenase